MDVTFAGVLLSNRTRLPAGVTPKTLVPPDAPPPSPSPPHPVIMKANTAARIRAIESLRPFVFNCHLLPLTYSPCPIMGAASTDVNSRSWLPLTLDVSRREQELSLSRQTLSSTHL